MAIYDKSDEKSTNFLYGCNPGDFSSLVYKEALAFKKESGKRLLKVLVRDENMTNTKRINAVLKAIKFTEKLLDEIKEKDQEKVPYEKSILKIPSYWNLEDLNGIDTLHERSCDKENLIHSNDMNFKFNSIDDLFTVVPRDENGNIKYGEFQYNKRKSIYAFLDKHRCMAGDECLHDIFYNIYEIKLVRVKSPRKAEVLIRQILTGNKPFYEKATLVFKNYKGGINPQYRIYLFKDKFEHNPMDFSKFWVDTLNRLIIKCANKTFMPSFYQNNYLSERLSRIILRRMHKILIKTNKNNPLGIKVYNKYYNTWNQYSNFITAMNKEYIANGNKWPEKYLYPSWYRKELKEEKNEK